MKNSGLYISLLSFALGCGSGVLIFFIISPTTLFGTRLLADFVKGGFIGLFLIIAILSAIKIGRYKNIKAIPIVTKALVLVCFSIGILAISTVLASSPALLKPLAETHRSYENTIYGFRFLYPEDWRGYAPQGSLTVGVYPPLSKTGIMVSKEGFGVANSQYVGDLDSFLTEEYIILNSSINYTEITFRSIPAYLITTEGILPTDEAEVVNVEIIIFIKENTAYTLLGIPSFDSLNVRNILDSFEFI